MSAVIGENLVGKRVRVRAADHLLNEKSFEGEIRAIGLDRGSFVLLLLEDDGTVVSLQCLKNLKIIDEIPKSIELS